MAEILTDSEIAEIQDWSERLIASHRALAAETDKLKDELVVADDALETQKGWLAESRTRVSALESACEAARKLFVGLVPELDRAEDVEAMIKRLEGAIEHGG